MRLTILVIGLLLTANATAADIYQWTDAQGRVHFGDRPQSGAASPRPQAQPNVIRSVQPGARPETREVVLYSTQRCGFCRKARAHFAARGIAYTEYDVETTEKGWRDYNRMNGRGVPIILIGGERMNGFSASLFDQMYEQP
jgi:glutaredoxin